MEWLEQVQSINVDTVHGRRAPYKPLLLLWMIGRVSRGESTKVQFVDAEEPLKDLMWAYRLGETLEVGLPFVHLTSDGDLWSLFDSNGNNISPPERKVGFLREEAVGELTPAFVQALSDQELLNAVVTHLLQSDFPTSTHEEILEKVGLQGKVAVVRPPRDSVYSGTVLLAYEYKCAFCGFDGRLENRHVGLDAAHIRMWAKGGPDDISNRICLCVLHHRLFDRGALSVDDNLQILVSQYFLESQNGDFSSVTKLVEQKMRLPQTGYESPAIEYLDWHRENLFRGPARLRM